jgi:hypothetical protein
LSDGDVHPVAGVDHNGVYQSAEAIDIVGQRLNGIQTFAGIERGLDGIIALRRTSRSAISSLCCRLERSSDSGSSRTASFVQDCQYQRVVYRHGRLVSAFAGLAPRDRRHRGGLFLALANALTALKRSNSVLFSKAVLACS